MPGIIGIIGCERSRAWIWGPLVHVEHDRLFGRLIEKADNIDDLLHEASTIRHRNAYACVDVAARAPRINSQRRVSATTKSGPDLGRPVCAESSSQPTGSDTEH